MTVLHKADQIKLFAVAKFCCHFVWKCYNIHFLIDCSAFLCYSNHHQNVFFSIPLLLHVSSVVDILSWSSEPEWVCTTENSQCDLY